jgi:hypothetical protein
VIALLHYAILKSIRDRSLPAFLFASPLAITAALAGVTLRTAGLHYPLQIAVRNTPLQNATESAFGVTLAVISFAAITAFWTFRHDVATKAVGSLIMTRRPIVIASTQVLFAALVGITSWICSMSVIAALTAAIPAGFGHHAAMAAIMMFVAASIGALAVTISTEPPAVVGALAAGVLCSPILLRNKTDMRMVIIAVVVAIACTVTCAVLLERRCAS